MALPYILGGLGLLGGAGSFFGRDNEAKKQAALQKKAMSLYQLAEENRRVGDFKALQTLKGGISEMNKGFTLARADLTGQGNTARRDIRQNQAQGLAQSLSSLQARGLGNASILDNARRGYAADTSRRLAEVDERLGALFSGLRLQQTQANMDATGQLTNFQVGANQRAYQGAVGYADMLLNSRVQKPDPFAALTSGLGSGLSAWYMGKKIQNM